MGVDGEILEFPLKARTIKLSDFCGDITLYLQHFSIYICCIFPLTKKMKCELPDRLLILLMQYDMTRWHTASQWVTQLQIFLPWQRRLGIWASQLWLIEVSIRLILTRKNKEKTELATYMKTTFWSIWVGLPPSLPLFSSLKDFVSFNLECLVGMKNRNMWPNENVWECKHGSGSYKNVYAHCWHLVTTKNFMGKIMQIEIISE